jgi:hypothetical protein
VPSCFAAVRRELPVHFRSILIWAAAETKTVRHMLPFFKKKKKKKTEEEGEESTCLP